MAITLTMSSKERERLKTLERVSKGELTACEAARALGISVRQVYRSLRRYRARGDAGLVHGLRGRPSNMRHPAAERTKALELFGTLYADYGPTLLAETLAKHHGLTISRETLRRWLLAAGAWKRARTRRRHRRRRPRRAAIGEMIQIDGSVHAWFGPDRPQAWLLVIVDDASSRLFARFVTAESIDEVLRTLLAYAQRYGLPQSVYSDRGSAYYGSDATPTDVGRALATLGIEMIQAHSPQAKGRVERENRTLQDRLVKALRRLGITTPEAGNRFLDETYLGEHNAAFAHLEGLADVHRPIQNLVLEEIFCREYTRVVANDYTVSLDGECLQLHDTGGAMPAPRARVVIRRRLDGTRTILWHDHPIPFAPFDPHPRTHLRRIPVPPPNHPWNGKRVGKRPGPSRTPRSRTVMEAALLPR